VVYHTPYTKAVKLFGKALILIAYAIFGMWYTKKQAVLG
jgi:hypothetical protein